MSIGFWQIAIVVVLVVLLFGRGKISGVMGDVAKGIKSFKKGMKDPVHDDSKTTSSEDIPFLKLLIPFATSPIKLEILPLPKSKTTSTTIIAICQKPILIMSYIYIQ